MVKALIGPVPGSWRKRLSSRSEGRAAAPSMTRRRSAVYAMHGCKIFLLRSDTVNGDTRVPRSASVMSATRRTEMAHKYIPISASSTEASRRLQRSMIAVSNGTEASAPFGVT